MLTFEVLLNLAQALFLILVSGCQLFSNIIVVPRYNIHFRSQQVPRHILFERCEFHAINYENEYFPMTKHFNFLFQFLLGSIFNTTPIIMHLKA